MKLSRCPAWTGTVRSTHLLCLGRAAGGAGCLARGYLLRCARPCSGRPRGWRRHAPCSIAAHILISCLAAAASLLPLRCGRHLLPLLAPLPSALRCDASLRSRAGGFCGVLAARSGSQGVAAALRSREGAHACGS